MKAETWIIRVGFKVKENIYIYTVAESKYQNTSYWYQMVSPPYIHIYAAPRRYL